ncbi:MAG: enoyl-CoA hydratase/isomerase family protein, partial [Brevibacterium sp.]|nr:enoyl-CoA hydratase/isomerase family protein [Brevibacterium sp.]
EAAVADARTTTIAAITGNCVGGGTELAAACDIRIAAPGSIFGVTAAKLGLVYPPGPTRRLAAVLGDSWARYLLVTASIVKFETMRDLGFFHEVSETPAESAQTMGEKIVGLSRLTQIGSKAILAGELSDEASPPQWLDDAYRDEITRGQEAFFAKRAPEFGFAATDWSAG